MGIVHSFYARAYLQQSDLTRAASHLDQALGICDQCSSVVQVRIHMAAGEYYAEQRQLEDAIDSYDAARQASREFGSLEVHGILKAGYCHLALDDLESAKTNFDAVIADTNRDGLMLYERAVAMFGKGRCASIERNTRVAARHERVAYGLLDQLPVERRFWPRLATLRQAHQLGGVQLH